MITSFLIAMISKQLTIPFKVKGVVHTVTFTKNGAGVGPTIGNFIELIHFTEKALTNGEGKIDFVLGDDKWTALVI